MPLPMVSRFSRRSVMRGSLAGLPVALGLPTFDAFLNSRGTAYADGAPLPTCFGVWFFGTGAYEGWMPKAVGVLPSVLPRGFEALTPHRSRVTMVSGLGFESFGDYATNRHYMGASSVLAGARPVGEKVGGITIDQAVAKRFSGTPRASLELGVTDIGNPISYNAANSPNVALRDPRQVMAKLFGGPKPSPATDAQAATRISYLDAVKGDIDDLHGSLGSHDKRRLEAYLEGINEIEKTWLSPSTSANPLCSSGADATSGITNKTVMSPEGWAAVNKAQSKLLALALACGITRVFSYNFSGPNSNPWFPNGVANTHHELGHQAHADLPKSIGFIMSRFAETLDELAAIKEGAGDLLARTGIVVLTETAWNHHDQDLPILIAGGGAGKLKGGLHVRSNGASTRAAFTVANALGANLTSFGTAGARVDSKAVISDVML